jgi:hypothetical protein
LFDDDVPNSKKKRRLKVAGIYRMEKRRKQMEQNREKKIMNEVWRKLL